MSPRYLPPQVPATTLRVFEPIDAFAPGLRRVWAEVVADPAAGREAEQAERWASWRAVLDPRRAAAEAAADDEKAAVDDERPAGDVGKPSGAIRPSGPTGRARARVLRVAGARLVCPAELTPDRSAGQGDELGHTLVRAWQLPAAWLAVVRPEDLTRSGGPGRYVLPMSRARARAARTLRTLRSSLGEVDLTVDAERLVRWLEKFHPRSWVELDTRAVAALVGGEDGADDVRLGLESLTVRDTTAAAAAYRRMSRRSHQLQELSVSS